MKTQARRLAAASLSMIAAAALLSACGRQDDSRTVGQKVDATIASAEKKTDELKADASRAGDDAKQAAERAADTVGSKTRDIAITAEINGKLAGDDRLSARHIDVDAEEGRVILRGNAPDMASRERATTLARAVKGVTSVDNQLTVVSQ
jgi:osmotically-inducible protein OsmY